jgi:hypothetical protein
MRSPGFWIAKIKKPDAVLLNGQEIEKLNSEFEENKLVNNLTKFGTSYFAGKNFGTSLKKTLAKYNKYKNEKLGAKNIKSALTKVSSNINFSSLNAPVAIQYGLAVKSSDLRIIPATIPLYSSKETEGLDRLQVTRLHLGEPLIVSYKTKDGKWFYVFAREAEGWMEASDIGFCNKETWNSLLKTNGAKTKTASDFVIVISAVADIYADEERTEFISYAQMGTRFTAEETKDNLVKIKMPSADNKGVLYFKEAFIGKGDISRGYLKYSRRNVLEQAFKYLNTPYGWGGQDDFLDCSSFIKNVFSCFGINLPRNSAAQIHSTSMMKNISFFKEDDEKSKGAKIMGKALEGASLLYFPGHIMLYIGQANHQPYAIHSIWGYRDKNDKNLYLINKTAVSGMNLGKNSKKGSLLERTSFIKNMSK